MVPPLRTALHEDRQRCWGRSCSSLPRSPARLLKQCGRSAQRDQTGQRLRPPDLVIQDELHLITGALGTTTGLFEVAMDTLTSWRTPDGKQAQPLLVASTATARNASDQVRALYRRYVTIFPPQVLDAGRTFFSREIPVSEESPGRRYIGISTTGVRLTTAEIRVSEVLMAAGQHLLDTAGVPPPIRI